MLLRLLSLAIIVLLLKTGGFFAAARAEQSFNAVIKKMTNLKGPDRLRQCRQLIDEYLIRHPNDPEALVHRGFLDNPDDFKSCKRFLTRALAVTKGGAGITELQQVYIVRAYANGNLGLKDEALADIEKARQIAPDNPEVYHIRGGIKQRFNMHAEALADLEKAATGDPRNRYCLEQLIFIASALNRNDKQLKWLNKLVELFPTYESYLQRSRFFDAMGRYNLASADCLRSIELRPDDEKAYATAYSIAFKAGDLKGAAHVIERARRRFPNSKNFKVAEADLAFCQKEQDRALALYKTLSKTYPQDPHLRERLGMILRDKQRYEEALEQFDVAAKYREPVELALHKRAESYRLAEQYANAARDFTQMYSKTSNRTFIVDAGDCWLKNNNYKRALSTFEIAMNKGPAKPLSKADLSRVYGGQAHCHLRLGDPDKARMLATKALEFKSSNMEAVLVRSQANTQLKRLNEAIADLTIAIQLEPDFVVPLEERAKLYDLNNQPELARKDRLRLAKYTRGIERDLINKKDTR